MIEYRCRKCIWFDSQHPSVKDIKKLIFGKYEIGFCRKHKPVIFSLESQYWGGWPLVDVNDLCGEFREEK